MGGMDSTRSPVFLHRQIQHSCSSFPDVRHSDQSLAFRSRARASSTHSQPPYQPSFSSRELENRSIAKLAHAERTRAISIARSKRRTSATMCSCKSRSIRNCGRVTGNWSRPWKSGRGDSAGYCCTNTARYPIKHIRLGDLLEASVDLLATCASTLLQCLEGYYPTIQT